MDYTPTLEEILDQDDVDGRFEEDEDELEEEEEEDQVGGLERLNSSVTNASGAGSLLDTLSILSAGSAGSKSRGSRSRRSAGQGRRAKSKPEAFGRIMRYSTCSLS